MLSIANNARDNLSLALQQLVLALLSGGMVSIAFLDHDQYWFAWVAFVPLLFAVEQATLVRTYCLGLIAGVAGFICATYWIAGFIVISKGYSLGSSLLLAFIVWLYAGHIFAFIMLLFNWLKKRTGVHVFLLFPLVVATFSSAYPMLFAMRLGETQVNFYSALQAVEFVGVHGLDAIIALVNILVFRLLYQCFTNGSATPAESKLPWVMAISIVILWFAYGTASFSWWEKEHEKWDTLKVGIVQPNETPSLGKTRIYPGYTYAYPPEMEMTERLNTLGADIVVWPEAKAKGYLDSDKIGTAYKNNIGALGTSLLFQDMQHIRDPVDGKISAQYNTALMLDENGHQAGSYQKIRHIPFGEYIPLVSENSLAGEWAKDFLGEFLNKLSPGKSHQVFKHKKVNIVPLICYETTYPSFVGSAIGKTVAQTDKSLGTLLVGLSNDGWFGSTHQPYQHIMPSVLRAVENRLPLVHVVNNGPSIVVVPSGKIIFTSDFQQAGGYIADVPHSKNAQGSFYSKHPRLFDSVIYVLITLIALYALTGLSRKEEESR